MNRKVAEFKCTYQKYCAVQYNKILYSDPVVALYDIVLYSVAVSVYCTLRVVGQATVHFPLLTGDFQ